MNALLIQPALSAAASAGHSVAGTAAAAVGTAASSIGAGSLGALNPAAFQRYMATLHTQGGVNAGELVGLKPGDLQKTLASLTPQQQLTMAQQLLGANVGVVNSGGQIVEGTASKLQVQDGQPVFQVNGQNYSLGQLVAVIKPAYNA